MKAKPVLFVMLSRFPFPLEKGDKLRAYHQLKGLSSDFDIILACTSEQVIGKSEREKVAVFCKEIHVFQLTKWGLMLQLVRTLFWPLPFQLSYFYRWNHARKIKKLIAATKPDHIFCQLVRVSEYVKDYHFCNKTIDFMDALSKGMERRIATEPSYKKWFYRMESRRLAVYERSVFDYFENKIIISEQDQRLILHPRSSSIHIVPNGVDASFFETMNIKKDHTLLFTGNFSYAPNIEAAVVLVNDILPELNKKGLYPSVLLSGANPAKRVLELASDKVEVTGWVDDIRSSYHRAELFVAPLFIGTGLQNKLLEAMACGVPCVTSTLANNALKGTNRQNVLLAEDISEFVEIISEHMHNDSNFNILAANGKSFVAKNYSWENQNKRLQSLFTSASL